MNAKEAEGKAVNSGKFHDNADELEKALQIIDACASIGYTYVHLYIYNYSVVNQLSNLGYIVSESPNNYYHVNWSFSYEC